MSPYTNKLHHNGYQSVPARVPIWAHPGTNLTASDVLGGGILPPDIHPTPGTDALRNIEKRCNSLGFWPPVTRPSQGWGGCPRGEFPNPNDGTLSGWYPGEHRLVPGRARTGTRCGAVCWYKETLKLRRLRAVHFWVRLQCSHYY